MHADPRDCAEAGLEADDAVERGRPDHRAKRLRAERQRYDPGGDGRSRPR